MTLQAQAAAFFEAHPDLEFGALGPAENLELLPETVWGVRVAKLATETHPHLPEQYLQTNQLAFGKLSLLRWVLSDLFLMPGFLGVLLSPASGVKPTLREHLRVEGDRRIIGAAYAAAPTLHPGRFVGASLLSFLEARHCAAWAKSLTLKLCGASAVRGVAQWDNPSLRVHTRLGPLRLVGRPPGGHEYQERTFVYETGLHDESAWAAAMRRSGASSRTVRRIRVDDFEALDRELDRAMAGARLAIVPPGIEDGAVLLSELPESELPESELPERF